MKEVTTNISTVPKYFSLKLNFARRRQFSAARVTKISWTGELIRSDKKCR